jgi:peptidoglycan/LPS O-acetylase OafA/YrhL
MRYRPEVDGLRAIAIIPVVAFHAGITQLSGGFVGVDVFFVISGYLITKIIVEEIEGGKFSLLDFYRRRILRIIPVLIVVVLATSLFGYFLFLPAEFEDLAKSVVATAFFSSNFYFWQTSGYFDPASTLRPLLHTWSLAVEEQFYLFFPLLILAIHRFGGRRYGGWIFAFSVLSFVASVLGVFYEPSATFYLLPARGWELGLGALIAVGWFPKVESGKLRFALSGGGILCICFALFYLDEESLFPGWNALFPVVGAALLVAYGQGTTVGRFLSAQPMRHIGLVSYAWYLWHWPVIVYWKLVYGELDTFVSIAFVISLSFLLAVISRPLVEQPFRVGFSSRRSARVVQAGLASLCATGVLGVTLAVVGQQGRYFPPEILRVANFSDYRSTPDYEFQFRMGRCMLGERHEGTSLDVAECLTLDPARPNFLVIGDSHAAHMWRALALEIPEWNFLQATVSGCRPLIGTGGAGRCTFIRDSMFSEFLGDNRIDGVVLAARWREGEVAHVAETIEFLQQHVGKVIVLGPVPEYRGSLPLLLAQSMFHNNSSLVARSRDESRAHVDAMMSHAVTRTDATYISEHELICANGDCRVMLETGTPMAFDYGHFTLEGARWVAVGVRAALTEKWGDLN